MARESTDFDPCADPPPIGSTVWVLGLCGTREEMPFPAVIIDVLNEPFRPRLKLRGFRDNEQEEWSIPQGSYGFTGLYFRTEQDVREHHLNDLKNHERRLKRETVKIRERIDIAKDALRKSKSAPTPGATP